MRHLLSISLLILLSYASAQQVYNRTLKLMGSRFDITVVEHEEATANRYIDLAVNEISRIEKLISSWDPNSQTSEINRNAGLKAVQVDSELFDLIGRALVISKITDGAFDISYASMDRIWKFDGSMSRIPDDLEITRSVEKVGYEDIILDQSNRTVFLKRQGMKIGFGAIGKGYAADKAKELLINVGVKAGIINASGDMNTWGKRPGGSDWMVAITNPFDKEKAYALLPIHGAVVTSGNYEKIVKLEGRKFSHIIDPRTGWPTTGIISATVFAEKAELADALATSVFVMGIQAGLDRINQIPRVECVIVDMNGGLHKSEGIEIEHYEKN